MIGCQRGDGDAKWLEQVNPFNIPRANVLVHVRRMRLAYLGIDKAARVDKRLESRLDRSTHRSSQAMLFFALSLD